MAAETPRSYFSHLECPVCGQHYSGREPTNFCACGRRCWRVMIWHRSGVMCAVATVAAAHDLWRYRELLPVLDEANVITLGEGGTPLLPLRRLERSWASDISI